MPKVSVVIPIYNVEMYLKECLDSIINQTLQDIEIICINDGSSDKSLDILHEYEKCDKRIIIYSQENKGQSAARNLGLQYAIGEYSYFMDSDDILELDALRILYLTAVNNDVDILLFGADAFYEKDILEKKYANYKTYYTRNANYEGIHDGITLFIEMARNNDFKPSPCMQFIKTTFLKSNGINFYEGIIHEDNLFSFICLMEAKKVGYINNVFFHRRVREESTMTKKNTAANVIGYYICFTQMFKFCLCKEIQNDIIEQYLKKMLENAKYIYICLNKSERKKVVFKKYSLEEYLFEIQVKKQFRRGCRWKCLLRKMSNFIIFFQNNGFRHTLNRIKQRFF